MDNAEAIRIVLARGFAIPPRFNRRLIENEAGLRREIKATRERGYGLAIEEGEVGTIAIACAIHDPKISGRGVGVVTVAGPAPRLTQLKITEIIEDVRAAAADRIGRFQLEAAIQSAHAARRTHGRADWDAIVTLYDGLAALTASPVIRLNRAAAIAHQSGAAPGFAELEALDAALKSYQPYWALRADLLARLECREEARAAYDEAIARERDVAVIRFLSERRARV